MKVIKVGANAPPRIAQACDRCRSKKIRCDGIRPTCTQCTHVGFECKTSDKLSRRAFPRGYTESLEERVRALESEIRHLKAALSERDNEVAKFQGTSPISRETVSEGSVGASALPNSNTIEHTQPPRPDAAPSENRFRMLEVKRLERQLEGFPGVSFQADMLVPPAVPVQTEFDGPYTSLNERTTADIDTFFSVWAHLFPILSRGDFMDIYRVSLVNPQAHHMPFYATAQVYLVLAIVEDSRILESKSESRSAYYNFRWQSELDSIARSHTLEAYATDPIIGLPLMQTILLAIIQCLQTSNLTRLYEYMRLAAHMCEALGLSSAQDLRQDLSVTDRDARKRAFWCYYTLESFSIIQVEMEARTATMTIGCEFPDDQDPFGNVIVPSSGRSHGPPLAAATALFRLARILTQVWGDLGSSLHTRGISSDVLSSRLQSFRKLLEVWLSGLPSHFRVHNFPESSSAAAPPEPNSFVLRFAFSVVSSLVPKVATQTVEWSSLSPSYLLICRQALEISLYAAREQMIIPLPLNYPYEIVQFILPLLSNALNEAYFSEDARQTSSIVHSCLLLLRNTIASNAASEIVNLIDKVLPRWATYLSRKNSQAGEASSDTAGGEESKHGNNSSSEWTELVSRLDGGESNNIYDTIYGGPGAGGRSNSPASSTKASMADSPSITPSNSFSQLSNIVKDPGLYNMMRDV